MMLSGLVAAARDLVLGEPCAGCGRMAGEGAVCARCRAALAARPVPVRPLRAPAGFPITMAATRYDAVVRRLVIAHKEGGRLELAAPLGRLLAAAIVAPATQQPVVTVLVPIPSDPSATRHRGHDPVLRMTKASRRWLPSRRVVVRSALRHRRHVRDQSGLDVDQRAANLRDALVASDDVHAGAARADLDVVLTDDVCSSGATLAAALAALVRVGVPASRIRAAVVATPVLRV